ncbi:uncharacterized protein A1O9_07784 [Exophiala aquamarina CBS 119918]|uniref:DUF3824 domain-containing protein n=1 Tax=Exophiala aquamarina CBS 119918 TaxID=1182545 RepID=A0A072PAA9_9EURO|nr:uncharacterized protein A1O9_07784 [Exophiala aquamarina CBS 119918]KEF56203.1 hypothetical protein A1O9_07784 [Exophiala aquamarina CBS 119918]
MTSTSNHHAFVAAGAAPLMSQHPAFRGQQLSHENPFVPVPPPPRRSTPNSRAGLTDGMVPGGDPFLEKEIRGSGRPSTSRSRDSSNQRLGALAAGVAGAAVGAGLIHHHNRKQQDDEKTLVTEEPSHPATEPQFEPNPVPQSKITRKPVPINSINNSDLSWPYSPVSPIDPAAESAALAEFPTRSSQESLRSFSRDAARANAAFDREYSPQTGLLHKSDLETSQADSHGHGQALATAAAGLAVGGIGGAALVRHHDNQRRSRSSSSGSGNRCGFGPHSHSESPHRLSDPFQRDESTPLSSTDNSSNNIYAYSDALPTQPSYGYTAGQAEEPILSQQVAPPAPPAAAAAAAAQPQPYSQTDPYGIPPVPVTGSRRKSTLGTAAPGAAAFSYINRPAIPSPLSSEVRHDYRSDPPPRMPSRSPRRSSRGASGGIRRASQDSTPYDDVYSSNPGMVSNRNDDYQYHPQYSEPQDLHDSVLSRSDKAIVGDNGYPHMGIPRRKSGGEYDFESSGPFGPQTLPGSAPNDDAGTRSSTLKSDDSTWRLSSGMPGGWCRASGEHSRLSGEQSTCIPGRLRAGGGGGGWHRYYEGVGQAL